MENVSGMLCDNKVPHAAEVIDAIQKELARKLDIEASVRKSVFVYKRVSSADAEDKSTITMADKAAAFDQILKLYCSAETITTTNRSAA